MSAERVRRRVPAIPVRTGGSMLVKSNDGTERWGLLWSSEDRAFGKGFPVENSQLLVRKEGAVSKISSPDISDEELSLKFAAITTAASRFQRTLDDGHLCSRRLLCSSFLSLRRNTDEYQYYFPPGGKWQWVVAKLPEGGGRLSQLKELFFILSPPKCIFVHVKGCVAWLNESSDSACTKHALSFFNLDAEQNEVERSAHVTYGNYSFVFRKNERL